MNDSLILDSSLIQHSDFQADIKSQLATKTDSMVQQAYPNIQTFPV